MAFAAAKYFRIQKESLGNAGGADFHAAASHLLFRSPLYCFFACEYFDFGDCAVCHVFRARHWARGIAVFAACQAPCRRAVGDSGMPNPRGRVFCQGAVRGNRGQPASGSYFYLLCRAPVEAAAQACAEPVNFLKRKCQRSKDIAKSGTLFLFCWRRISLSGQESSPEIRGSLRR